ncbi:MAG TPA: non-canonical purine NTP pyrophosphatase, partial [Ruminococcaceae bacterium]|nr:non-canonical purine NTP pyrophosphatase [Oscillospiraceae bacterium]
MKFVIATGNEGKVREFKRILEPMGFEVSSLKEMGLSLDVEETGATFAENARIKAKEACRLTGLAAIADDSGLCVDALGGAPGVYSARYLGEDTSYIEKNSAIIASLNGIAETERTASFRCAIALVTKDGEHVFTGRIDGRIG